MTVLGWVLIALGALANFLAKPILKMIGPDDTPNEKALYVVKLLGMWLVIVGAVMIFIAGGKVDVGAA